MKGKPTELSRRYVAALRKHLNGLRARFQPAADLGLETLELARIHERTGAALEIPDAKRRLIQRARMFFTEAVIPVVQTHRARMQNQSNLARARRSGRHGAWRRG